MAEDGPNGFVIGFSLATALFVFLVVGCDMRGRDYFEREAVKHGAATWTVDENGNRVFKWKGQE